MKLQPLLLKYNIKAKLDMILDMWNESHRSYHGISHLMDINDMIFDDYIAGKIDDKTHEKLLLVNLFHDAIYDPLKNNNEEKSAEFFHSLCLEKKNKDILEIKQAILDTNSHIGESILSKKFNKYDMNIVERDLDSLLIWENGIYNEYKCYGDKYKEGRLKFLNSLLDKYPLNSYNLSKLIEHVENKY